MRAENCQKPRKIAVFHGIVLVALQFGFVLNAAQPRLTQPTWSGGQFQFTLQGETDVGYLIETSTNLGAWTRVVTNSESSAVRTIMVPAAESQSFWRARAPLFQNAITATGIVTNGGNGWIDSFDSADPNFSTSGQYDPAKQKAGGNIVTSSSAVGAVSVGNMRVAGVVRTGPGGTVTLNTNGGVGSLAWLYDPTRAGMIEPGYVNDDVIVSIPAAILPNSFGPLKVPGVNVSIDGTNYDYALYSGDYRISGDLILTARQKMLVIGKARLFVTGTLSTSGQAFILIGTNSTVSDASLEIYAGGDVAASGSGVINVTESPRKFLLVGLNGCTSVRYSGVAPLIGTIYAPRADVTILGTPDLFGAVVGKTVKLIGTLGLHFDESLKRSGPF